MQLFKISIKFEQDGEWSEREADLEGYLVKRCKSDDTVEGYLRILYPTGYGPLRYVRGLYTSYGSLIFMQLCNSFRISPVCYCFPEVNQQGYWCTYTEEFGFFPILPGHPCSLGHATIRIEEISNEEKLLQETLAFFEANADVSIPVNHYLLADSPYLTDFLKPDAISQMQLHCRKW